MVLWNLDSDWTFLALVVFAMTPPSIAQDAGGFPEVQPLEIELPAEVIPEINVSQAPESAKSLLKALLSQALPQDYEKTKGWGATRKRWDGLQVRTDGLKIRTKRRWKNVNHGTWKKYRLEMVDPEEHLVVRIFNLREMGLGKIAFNLKMGAKLNVQGRLQEWNNGVRLVSMSAEAVADVELQIGLQVSTSMNPAKFPPDVIVKPRAESANVSMTSFQLKRLSQADGSIVRELGEAIEHVVQDKIKNENAKLTEKINRQFEMKQDDLRLSLHDLVKNQWLGLKPKSGPSAATNKVDDKIQPSGAEP